MLIVLSTGWVGCIGMIDGGGSFSLVEANEDGAHVVHSVLVAAVFGHQFVQQLFYDLFAGNLFGNTLLHPLHHLAIALNLPYTVAPHYYKVYLVRSYLLYVRVGCYHLILRLQTGLLVLQVPQSP